MFEVVKVLGEVAIAIRNQNRLAKNNKVALEELADRLDSLKRLVEAAERTQSTLNGVSLNHALSECHTAGIDAQTYVDKLLGKSKIKLFWDADVYIEKLKNLNRKLDNCIGLFTAMQVTISTQVQVQAQQQSDAAHRAIYQRQQDIANFQIQQQREQAQQQALVAQQQQLQARLLAQQQHEAILTQQLMLQKLSEIGKQVQPKTGSPDSPVSSLSSSPDSSGSSLGGDATPVKPKRVAPPVPEGLSHANQIISGVQLSHSTIATGDTKGDIKIWDLASGREIKTLTEHRSNIIALLKSDDGLLISASYDRTINIWDVRRPEGQELIRTLKGHDQAITSLALLPENRLLSGSSDGTAKVWDLNKEYAIKILSGHGESIHAVAFIPSTGQVATGSYDETIKIWDIDGKNAKCVRTLGGDIGLVDTLAISNRGDLISSSETDKNTRVWDIETGENISTINYGASSICVLRSGLVSCASGNATTGKVDLIDVYKGAIKQTLPGCTESVRTLFPVSGHLVTGGSAKMIKWWDVEKNQQFKTKFTGHMRDAAPAKPYVVTAPGGPSAARLAPPANVQVPQQRPQYEAVKL